MDRTTLEIQIIKRHLELLHEHYWRKGWGGIDPGHFQEAFIRLRIPLIRPETLLYLLDGSLGIPFTNYEWFQRLLSIEEKPEPKAAAIAVRAYCALHSSSIGALNKVNIEALCKHLWNLRNKGTRNPSWGASYAWRTAIGKIFEARGPSVLVTSLVGLAFLDAYRLTRNTELLERAIAVGMHVMYENGYAKHPDGSVCFYYSPLVRAQITNASAFAAFFLRSLYIETNESDVRKMSEAALEFILKAQNPDGSWYYYPLRNAAGNVVDNYHTGFVLEALLELYDMDPQAGLLNHVTRGIEFYSHMFRTNGSPIFNNTRHFPICIHDVAQGMNAFALCQRTLGYGLNKALRIWEYARTFMATSDGGFVSRIYPVGRSYLRSPRWADSWIFLGLIRIARALQDA